MSKGFHSDKHGIYDMDAVHAITPAIEKKDGATISKKAVLHFPGGGQLTTNTDYDKLVESWKTGEPVEKKAAKPVVEEDGDDE